MLDCKAERSLNFFFKVSRNKAAFSSAESKLSFSCLAISSRELTISTSMLVEAFTESLSDLEAGELQKALETFSLSFFKDQKAILVSILCHFGCRVCPTPQNIESITISIAKFVF